MTTADIMKNPAFTPILFAIERRILDTVLSASAAGIELNDSQIRSTLNKVRKTSEGNTPKIPDVTPRDQILAKLHSELLESRKSLILEDENASSTILPVKLWILCIRTIEDSIQRHSTGPGSKGCQHFIKSFMAKTR